MKELFHIRLRREVEQHRRIVLAVWAYAYEIEGTQVVSDAAYDEVSRKVDLTITTDRPDLDDWFKKEFNADTGMWIHKHPELDKIAGLYHEHYANKKR